MRESIWKQQDLLPAFPTQQGDIKTDVLIIGGGMAGILTAYYLRQAGVDCVLVEKDTIAAKTTGNTTAKITAQHGLLYHKLCKQQGKETAQKVLTVNRLALSEYARLSDTIACDYEEKTNYVYSKTDGNVLEQEMNALASLGFRAEYREQPPIPVNTVGAVGFARQAQFHPLKLIAGLAKDLPIYENTFVTHVSDGAATTNHGHIFAKRTVIATHFPFWNRHGNYFLKLYQHRSYVLALNNPPELNGMYVDDDQTGYSFRTYGDYLLLGGGGHRTGKQGGGWAQLRTFAQTQYPAGEEVCHWAAQDCMSLDGLPYIGLYSPNTPHVYVATGFNKWGMTGSMVSALLLRDRVLGKCNPFASAFDPARSMLRPQLLVNGFQTAANFLVPTAKRCPHLGCALTWNKAERTWDCSCHGSRFDREGKVLENPANGDLTKKVL